MTPAPAQNLLKDITRTGLDNGLTVFVKEDHRLPVVTVMIWYRVGSVNEQDGVTGTSHFLEHMMFKGTDKYHKGDIDLITFKNGGQNNAYTDTDFTAYYFTWSSDRWLEALEIEASRMNNCVLDAKEFEAEKAVVLEEYNRMMDSPLGPLSIEMDRTMFTSHPYRHPVLGWRKDLDSLTRDQMAEYYKKYYAPNNATLVVVGDIDTALVQNKVRDLFGPIPAGASTADPIPREPRQEEERRVQVETDHEVDRLTVCFRAEPIGSESDYVLDVASSVLTGGKNSRLYQRLVEKDKLAAWVESRDDSRKYDGIFSVYAEAVPGAKLADVERVILEELDKLKTVPVTARELEKAKNNISSGFLFGKETSYGMAEAIGQYETIASLEYLNTYLQKIQSVTAEQISDAVAKYLTFENRTVGWAVAKGNRAAGGGEKWGHRESPRRMLNHLQERIPAVNLGEPWEVHLRNGLTVMVMPEHNLPIVSISAHVNAGSVYDPEDRAGLSNVVGDLLAEGTHDPIAGVTRTHEDIAEAIEFVGGSLSTSSTGVSMKAMSKDTVLLLDLLKDILRYPTFPEDRLDQVKALTLSQIKAQADQPAVVARRLFDELVYQGHPLHRPAIGYAETVGAITREDVQKHYDRFYRGDNTIIAVAGDVDPVSVIHAIKQRFVDWVSIEPLALPKIPPIARQDAPKHKFEYRPTQQLNMYFGHVGIDRFNPDYYALQVMDHILGTGPGFTDRLSKQLRDEEGLAYTVHASITGSAGMYPGTFNCFMGTQPLNKTKAVEGILREVTKFIDQGPSEEEVRTSKDYLMRSFVLDFETTGQLADTLVQLKRYGLGIDYPKKYSSLIESVTRDDVMRVAKKYIDVKNATLVIVGPVNEKGDVVEVNKEKK